MCGRYYIDVENASGWLPKSIAEIERRPGSGEALAKMRLGEIYPSDVVPVLAQGGAQLMKWGYSGYKNRVINARSETAFEKAMFRSSLLGRRCLIPASGYYEWRRTASGSKTKQKFALYRPGQPTYMAGLWREERNEELPVFVILTREAAPEIADIHDRMPVILPDAALDGWIADGDPERLMAQAVQEIAYQAVP